MHENLFQHVEDRSEFYEVLKRDMKRDTRYVQISAMIATGLAIYAAKQGVDDGWPWLIGALLSANLAVAFSIDLSNRNFFMHFLDWQENERQYPEKAHHPEEDYP